MSSGVTRRKHRQTSPHRLILFSISRQVSTSSPSHLSRDLDLKGTSSRLHTRVPTVESRGRGAFLLHRLQHYHCLHLHRIQSRSSPLSTSPFPSQSISIVGLAASPIQLGLLKLWAEGTTHVLGAQPADGLVHADDEVIVRIIDR
jgi:hypothetical protein